MPVNTPKKHHYIPVFYLKRWAGEDGRLCEFSRPYDHRVKPRRTHPAGTGYEENLYSMQGFEPELAQQIEERFFKFTDSLAADALDRLVTKGVGGRLAQRTSVSLVEIYHLATSANPAGHPGATSSVGTHLHRHGC
ncbi:MAG: DUF4238 domain-containing protein [Mesorhizobium sp.]|nr:MAG: DUF4238 domain-containing protein [Mesorhizobium sp.]